MDRALIVEGFWLDKILSGSKTWEMRSTRTKIRGKIGLIEKGTGLIVGEADLIESLDALDPEQYYKHVDKHRIPRISGVPEKWPFPWVLENAKRYSEPKHYKHPRGAVVWVKLNKGK